MIPAQIVQLALKKKFQVVTSDFILEEVERNLIRKFQVHRKRAKSLIYRIAQVAGIIEASHFLNLVKR